MSSSSPLPLRLVDGMRLGRRLRDALLPGYQMVDDSGQSRKLPRYFYEITSWQQAQQIQVSANFALSEFIQTDVRENPALRGFPRYVPCAITMLALSLEQFRSAVGTFVYIAANGGYRSPTHATSRDASPHCWGTAVNIYRIGDTFIDGQAAIERFAAVARSAMPGSWTRPAGRTRGFTSDHLHVDFGYVLSVPRGAPSDRRAMDSAKGEPW